MCACVRACVIATAHVRTTASNQNQCVCVCVMCCAIAHCIALTHLNSPVAVVWNLEFVCSLARFRDADRKAPPPLTRVHSALAKRLGIINERTCSENFHRVLSATTTTMHVTRPPFSIFGLRRSGTVPVRSSARPNNTHALLLGRTQVYSALGSGWTTAVVMRACSRMCAHVHEIDCPHRAHIRGYFCWFLVCCRLFAKHLA